VRTRRLGWNGCCWTSRCPRFGAAGLRWGLWLVSGSILRCISRTWLATLDGCGLRCGGFRSASFKWWHFDMLVIYRSVRSPMSSAVHLSRSVPTCEEPAAHWPSD